MRLILLILSCLIILPGAAPAPLHKYYVSHTTLRLNPQTQMFEVTIRLFTHDLEWALARDQSVRLDLGGKYEPAFADGLVRDYLRFHFAVALNGTPIDLSYLGKEVDNDRTFCYLEFPSFQGFSSITIENKLLTDVFDEQKNYLELEVSGWKQSLVFTSTQFRQVISR